MSEGGVGWIGTLFIILAMVLFVVAYYQQSYGFGLFGVAAFAIGALAFVYRDQGG